eukprot:TRINITY_DN1596_c0_g1_i1.p1 TRINITY_DN1596_c0_g1~~TRINITY_DN1596_c0_g1_i1.p1  ORF type:complete len:189 (-),score=20.85 TRINITY_DN1596_c0_g1_i1:38-604(-)
MKMCPKIYCFISYHYVCCCSVMEEVSEETPTMNFLTDLWNQRIKGPLLAVFKQGLTPEALAMSFAFGITGGVFPVPGITTLICMVLIYLFKLNVAATQIVNFMMTPVLFATFIPFMKLGNYLLGADEDLSQLLDLVKSNLFQAISVASLSFLRGIFAWFLLSPFMVAAAYYILLPIVRRFMPSEDKFL